MYDQLDLTADQQAAAAELYANFMKRDDARIIESIGKLKGSIEQLKDDTTTLMRVMLANDAYKRGKVTEEDRKLIQAEAENDLKDIMKADYKFGSVKALDDEAFVNDFSGLLSPEQAATFQSSFEQRNAPATDGGDDEVSTTLDFAVDAIIDLNEGLDENDRKITNAKKFIGSMTTIFEAQADLQESLELERMEGNK